MVEVGRCQLHPPHTHVPPPSQFKSTPVHIYNFFKEGKRRLQNSSFDTKIILGFECFQKNWQLKFKKKIKTSLHLRNFDRNVKKIRKIMRGGGQGQI